MECRVRGSRVRYVDHGQHVAAQVQISWHVTACSHGVGREGRTAESLAHHHLQLQSRERENCLSGLPSAQSAESLLCSRMRTWRLATRVACSKAIRKPFKGVPSPRRMCRRTTSKDRSGALPERNACSSTCSRPGAGTSWKPQSALVVTSSNAPAGSLRFEVKPLSSLSPPRALRTAAQAEK